MKIITLKDGSKIPSRDLILHYIPDVIGDFLSYQAYWLDTKDGKSSTDIIKEAIEDGDITVEDIVKEFSLQIYATFATQEWKEYKEYQKNIKDESRAQNEN